MNVAMWCDFLIQPKLRCGASAGFKFVCGACEVSILLLAQGSSRYAMFIKICHADDSATVNVFSSVIWY